VSKRCINGALCERNFEMGNMFLVLPKIGNSSQYLPYHRLPSYQTSGGVVAHAVH
jgi:hypothetical protein